MKRNKRSGSQRTGSNCVIEGHFDQTVGLTYSMAGSQFQESLQCLLFSNQSKRRAAGIVIYHRLLFLNIYLIWSYFEFLNFV